MSGSSARPPTLMKMRSALEDDRRRRGRCAAIRSARGPGRRCSSPVLRSPASTPVRDCAGDLVLARLDARHVDGDAPPTPTPNSAARRAICAAYGARDHRLGRDAAGVDAGAAKAAALDDGDFPAGAGEAVGDERPGLPGADDDRVEAHVAMILFVPRCPQRRLGSSAPTTPARLGADPVCVTRTNFACTGWNVATVVAGEPCPCATGALQVLPSIDS